MLADDVAYVVGVDTHADSHTLAVVDAVMRQTRRVVTIPATRRGYREALGSVGRYAPGGRVWALEGSGSYGAGLAGFLAERGERVCEVERPIRRGIGARQKSDALDAERAAHHVLSQTRCATPRLGPQTQALRALLVTREGAVIACTAALNELRALLVTAPPQLRERLAGLSEARLIDACIKLRAPRDDTQHAAVILALRLLAQRIRHLRREAQTLERELTRRVHSHAPALLARPGVGPITAATLLIAWSHPGRIRNEAAFARLAGAAPIPASSGKTIRHRLDRGGDRRLNRALHTIALTLRRTDPTTQAYIAHRVAHGKTPREATRSLKRYLARSLYRQLEATTPT